MSREKTPMESKAKEEADRIYNCYLHSHVIITPNTKGEFISPYVSKVVGLGVMRHQAKESAIIHVDGVLSCQYDLPSKGFFKHWNEVLTILKEK